MSLDTLERPLAEPITAFPYGRGPAQERGTGNGDPDWDAWLAMAVPCVVERCDNDVEWWGNQHGCVRAQSCDDHTMKFVALLRGDLSRNGFIACNRCKRSFLSVEEFFTAVRI